MEIGILSDECSLNFVAGQRTYSQQNKITFLAPYYYRCATIIPMLIQNTAITVQLFWLHALWLLQLHKFERVGVKELSVFQ